MRSLRTAVATAVCGLIVIGSTAPGAEQQPAPAEPSRSPSPLRVSVDLVQIDATVTDQNGRHVTNLDTADFEVSRTTARRRFQPFSTSPPVPRRAFPAKAPQRPLRPVPPFAPPTRDGVRRTMAVVVDNLNLSFESIPRVRAALRRFIDEQMRPGDLVAILRTAAGMGALQQFTTDRRALHAAADRVRWTMTGRILSVRSVRARRAPRAAGEGGLRGRHARRDSYVMRGIEQLPGRKGILLLSDGFRLTDADMKYGRILDMMHAVADAASRAGVVIYGIDLGAWSRPGRPRLKETSRRRLTQLALRQAELRETRDSLDLLSHETGGFMIADTNDISGGVGRILDDQQGFSYSAMFPRTRPFPRPIRAFTRSLCA